MYQRDAMSTISEIFALRFVADKAIGHHELSTTLHHKNTSTRDRGKEKLCCCCTGPSSAEAAELPKTAELAKS